MLCSTCAFRCQQHLMLLCCQTLLWVCVQLMMSQFIDAERLLKVIPHARLLEIQALLQKHLGDHKEALRLEPCCCACASTLFNVSCCHALRRSGLLVKCFA